MEINKKKDKLSVSYLLTYFKEFGWKVNKIRCSDAVRWFRDAIHVPWIKHWHTHNTRPHDHLKLEFSVKGIFLLFKGAMQCGAEEEAVDRTKDWRPPSNDEHVYIHIHKKLWVHRERELMLPWCKRRGVKGWAKLVTKRECCACAHQTYAQTGGGIVSRSFLIRRDHQITHTLFKPRSFLLFKKILALDWTTTIKKKSSV